MPENVSEMGPGPDSPSLSFDTRNTIQYIAPELFNLHGIYSYTSDIWALGCILYELSHGYHPFQISDTTTYTHTDNNNNSNANISINSIYSNTTSNTINMLKNKILTYDPLSYLSTDLTHLKEPNLSKAKSTPYLASVESTSRMAPQIDKLKLGSPLKSSKQLSMYVCMYVCMYVYV